MDDDAEGTIRDYYDALRAGEPIHTFFADDGPVVKVGIGERMVGADAVAEGLREQTRTTTDWVVESRDLHVGAVAGDVGSTRNDGSARGDDTGDHPADDAEPAFAWFGDDVFMAWTDAERGIRFEFETRWSGAMVRRAGERGGDGEWRFVEMHVSTPVQT